jgi:hypothetical protein
MDNEPSIWYSTHRHVAPTGANYSEIYDDYLNSAGMVRAMDPAATIIGPEEWCWLALFYSGFDQQKRRGARLGLRYSQQHLLLPMADAAACELPAKYGQ